MRPVHISIGHNNDAIITQITFTIFFSRSTTNRLNEVGNLLVCSQFIGASTGDIQYFYRVREALPGSCGFVPVLAETACAISLNNKQFCATSC